MSEDKLVIKDINMCYDGVNHHGNIIVFVPENRPFDKGEVIEDLIWRRTHEQPFSEEKVLEAVRDTIIRMGHFIKRIEYSRYAGCGICPCSPGYVIYTDQEVYDCKTAVWLVRE